MNKEVRTLIIKGLKELSNHKKRKVLLIFPGRSLHPPLQLMPLSVMSLVAPLKHSDFLPTVLDQRVTKDWHTIIGKFCRDPEALFVGISTLTGTTIKYGLEAARLVRQISDKIPIVWGGVHPSLIPEQTLESDYVDIVCRGEGERVVVELAKALREEHSLAHVKSISYKTNGRIIHNPDEGLIDLDSLPEVDYTSVDIKKYRVADYFQYQTSSGCPHRCEFCDVITFNRRTLRKKSVSKVLDELEHIVKTFSPRTIEFIDDNFLADLTRVKQICQGIKQRNLDFHWLCTCRPDYSRRIDVQYLKDLKSAGCIEIYVGAESGSQRILDLIQKDCKVEDIYDIAEKICESGIRFNCNFMCGFPGETREDIEATLNLMKKLIHLRNSKKADVVIGGVLIYTPYPGTPLYEKVKKMGFNPPERFEDWATFRLNQIENISWHDNKHKRYIYSVAMTTRGLFGVKLIHLIKRAAMREISLHNFSVIAVRSIWELLKIIGLCRFKFGFYSFPFEAGIVNFIRDQAKEWR